MKAFSAIALAAVIGATGLSAMPALAAGSVPYCSTSGDEASLARAQNNLSQELNLSTKPFHSIDVWNGCFKVIVTDSSGHTSTAFYDPDTLNRVGELG